VHAVRAGRRGRPQPEAQGPMSALLDVRGLTVTYRIAGGDVPAVRGVDLWAAAGEKLGLAGESGCGKSSLALALMRLLPRNAAVGGEVLFDGDDVLKMS